MEAIAEPLFAGWPLALMLAAVTVGGRIRVARRRRALNRALHELRRPLQVLALSGPRAPRAQLDAAIAALAVLDREINGGAAPSERHRVEASALARDAVARWRAPTLARGRTIELTTSAERCPLECDASRLARALDNLIANALEHGDGPIRVACTVRPGRARLHVADGRAGPAPLAPAALPRRPHRDPRHGHGLELVARVASEHGGRFGACVHAGGASAVLELPLAERR